MRRIVSVWLPHLPIERLRRSHPGSIDDKVPIALVASEARGQIITALNHRALNEGVRSGMALADARAILPALRSRAAEPARDAAFLAQLARWVGRYGPNRNGDGSDGLWIDISGVAHLFAPPSPATIPLDPAGTAGETALLTDLVSRLTASGLTARAGLADSFGAAHALARFATRETAVAIAPPGATKSVLASLPAEALRLSAPSVLLLKRLGLGRVGDLYGLPRAALERRFRDKTIAARVLTRLDQALGISAEPCRPLTEPPVHSVRRIYAEPLIISAAIETEVQGLATDLAQRLAAVGQGARRIVLSLYRTDATTATIGAGTSRVCHDPKHLYDLIAIKLVEIDAGFGIDAIVMDAVLVERLEIGQAELVSTTDARSGDARSGDARSGDAQAGPGLLIDRLSNRLGASKVFRLEQRASHLPERAIATVPALHAGDRRPRLPFSFSRTAQARRPLFLLPRPEPINVLAEIPEGAPARFTWRRLPRRIIKADGPERIAPEWWRNLRDGPPAGAAVAVRDYYRLEDDTGSRYWVFRLGLYDSESETAPGWFMHGLFA